MARATVKTPTPPVPGTRYEDDVYTWVQEQVALLRAGKLNEIDALNIAEELADVGKSEFNSLRSAIAVLTLHLLKWDHQPARRSRSWELSIREQRNQVAQVLEDSPGLKSRLPVAIERGYSSGRTRALDETGLGDEAIPEIYPYSFDNMMQREIAFGSR
jgi:Domain of unknown function DUF29